MRMLSVQHLLGKVLDRAGIGKDVDDGDSVFRVFFDEVLDQVRADETGAASDENTTHLRTLDPPRTLDVKAQRGDGIGSPCSYGDPVGTARMKSSAAPLDQINDEGRTQSRWWALLVKGALGVAL